MKGLEYVTSKTGFHTVLKDWQLRALQVVWGAPEGANSRTVKEKVNKVLDGESISSARASQSPCRKHLAR